MNIAEKCKDAATFCAQDDDLIWILIDSWGGYGENTKKRKNGVVLHLGLFHILVSRIKRCHGVHHENNANVDEEGSRKLTIEDIILCILKKEEQKKITAQERENARKQKG